MLASNPQQILRGGQDPYTTKRQRRAMRAQASSVSSDYPCPDSGYVCTPWRCWPCNQALTANPIITNLRAFTAAMPRWPNPGPATVELDQRQLAIVRSILKGKRPRGTTKAQRAVVRQTAKNVRAACKSRPELLKCAPGQSPIYVAAWHAYCCAKTGPVR